MKDSEIKVKTISAPDKTHGTVNQQFGKKDDKETQKIMKTITEYLSIKKIEENR